MLLLYHSSENQDVWKIKIQNLIFCLFISRYYFNSIPINALVYIDILTRAFIREKIKVVAWNNNFKFCILYKIWQISLSNWIQLSHPEFPKSVVKNLDRYKEKNDEKPVQLLYVVLQLDTTRRYPADPAYSSAILFIYIFLVSFFVVVGCGFVVALLLFSTWNICILVMETNTRNLGFFFFFCQIFVMICENGIVVWRNFKKCLNMPKKNDEKPCST